MVRLFIHHFLTARMEILWKERIMTPYKDYPVFSGENVENHENFSQVMWSLGWDYNLRHPDYEARVLTTRSQSSDTSRRNLLINVESEPR
jgi:hypothetical protein